jgi:hypothetical protein
MRSRQALVATLLALGFAVAIDAALADAQTKRSGTVVAVDVDRRTLTLEELGAAGQVERHVITLDPSVRVVEVERRGGPDTEGPGAWPGGFREVPARYLAPGDFVTITFGNDPAGTVARSIDVVRTEDPDTAAASPLSGAELPPRH